MGTKVNSNYEDLITFTRASKGHALRPVSYGDELVTNGTFDSDLSGWTDASIGSSSASVSSGKLSIPRVDGSNNAKVYQALSTNVGGIYVITLDVSSAALYVRAGTGTSGSSSYNNLNDFGIGTELRFQFVATSSTTYLTIGTATANGVTGKADNVSVKEVLFDQPDGTLTLFEHPNNIPRVEYDADGNRLGLLVEEQRTNLFTESEKLSEKDHSINTTDNAIISPDGNQTASFCKPSISVVEHFIDDANVTAGTDYAMSCFAKQGPGNYLLAFRGSGLGSNPPRFNLATGTVDNEGVSSAWSNTKIEDVGNGWYRCSSIANPNTTTPLRFQIVRSDGEHNFAGDGTSGLYIWGCQIEQASFPTSYIKTTGSTATRSDDVASIPVADFGFNTGAGTFVAEFQYQDPEEDDSNYLISGTSQARIMYNNPGSNNWQTFDGNGSVTFAAIDSDNGRFKLAVSVKTDSSQTTAKNGAIKATSTSHTALMKNLAGATLYPGGSSTSQKLNGHIKSIQYYPRRLTNAQLQALTEPRSDATLSLTFDGLESSFTENYIHG